jgi:hypothetical protein
MMPTSAGCWSHFEMRLPWGRWTIFPPSSRNSNEAIDFRDTLKFPDRSNSREQVIVVQPHSFSAGELHSDDALGGRAMTRANRELFFICIALVTAAANPVLSQTITVNTLQDLQNMQNNLAGSYVLGGNIDASPSATINGGTGFIPVGTAGSPFTGNLDGKGYTITGLTINSAQQYVGLFGYYNPGNKAGFIQNLTLARASITSIASSAFVGSIAGRIANNTNVLNCSAGGLIQAANSSYLGGLFGYIDSVARVQSTSSSVSVNSTTPGGRIGGFAGYVAQQSTLTNTQASGSVGGQSSGGGPAYIGGLVGQNSGGEILLSRASGSVVGTGNSIVGGLVGYENQSGTYAPPIGTASQYYITYSYPSIEQSFATGAVSTGANGNVGGLVGQLNPGDVDQSFATGNVTDVGGGGNEGGLVGLNGGGTITQSYATGNVSGNSANTVGGLVGANNTNGGTYPVYPVITDTFSIGVVSGLYPKYAGGLVGKDFSGGVMTDNYWATDTSTQPYSDDATGVTIAQLESGTLLAGFNSTIWSAVSGSLPSLVGNPAPVQGYINPKYQVVGVTYAPPGPSSSTFVQYTSGSTVGTSQSISQSFMQSNSVSITLTAGSPSTEKVFTWSVALGYSQMASQTVRNTSSVSTSFQVQEGEKTSGTGNYFYPVDHDYDVIWIWLNPTVILTVYPPGSAGSSLTGSVDWNGYGFDIHDQSDVDVIGIPLGYLNGDFGPIPPQFKPSLSRAWAATQTYAAGVSAALTTAELSQIASSDPFSASSYGLKFITFDPPSPNTADNRFAISACTGESGIPYLQANPSASGEVYTCSLTNMNTSMQSQDITSSYSQSYSIDATAEGDLPLFDISLKGEVKDQYSLTWTTEDQTSTSYQTTTSAALSVQGPPCNNVVPGLGPCVPVYDASGGQPIEFYVYEDNLYGTFMFAPVNYYTSGVKTTASIPTFTPAGGTYVRPQIVTIGDTTPTAMIFYTTDGTAPTTTSIVYAGPITAAQNETIKAIAVVADLKRSAIASATFSIAPQAATAPTFSVPSGTYFSSVTVTIADTTPGVSIYFTTNGIAPTSNSNLYSAPILIKSTETIEAIAVVNGYANSPVSYSSYIISTPPVAAAPTFSLPGGTYSRAQTVALYDSAPDATIYYTINGTTPTKASAVYTSPIMITKSQTVKALATAPGYSASKIASATYEIAPPRTAEPMLLPDGGPLL